MKRGSPKLISSLVQRRKVEVKKPAVDPSCLHPVLEVSEGRIGVITEEGVGQNINREAARIDATFVETLEELVIIVACLLAEFVRVSISLRTEGIPELCDHRWSAAVAT